MNSSIIAIGVRNLTSPENSRELGDFRYAKVAFSQHIQTHSNSLEANRIAQRVGMVIGLGNGVINTKHPRIIRRVGQPDRAKWYCNSLVYLYIKNCYF
jgi:hypothetical protein